MGTAEELIRLLFALGASLTYLMLSSQLTCRTCQRYFACHARATLFFWTMARLYFQPARFHKAWKQLRG